MIAFLNTHVDFPCSRHQSHILLSFLQCLPQGHLSLQSSNQTQLSEELCSPPFMQILEYLVMHQAKRIKQEQDEFSFLVKLILQWGWEKDTQCYTGRKWETVPKEVWQARRTTIGGDIQEHTQNMEGHYKNFKLFSEYNKIYLPIVQWTCITKCMSVWLLTMEVRSKVRLPVRRPVSSNRD